MTVVGFLSCAPVTKASMSDEVAAAVDALEDFDVTYEIGPMGTTIEAQTTDELFSAVQAAHEAVDADRVSTVLKIDDQRSVDRSAWDKVETVEAELGRPATNR